MAGREKKKRIKTLIYTADFHNFTPSINLSMKPILFVFLIVTSSVFSQYSDQFQTAYSSNPLVPKGLLESVAFNNTHVREISQSDPISCSGMPLPYGVMGVFENGAGYFIENGQLIASISGISVTEQKNSVENQIMAYAIAFNTLMQEQNADPEDPSAVYFALDQLTEIPDSGIVNAFARDVQIYSILKFMTESDKANEFNFTPHQYDLPGVFGESNYNVLSAKRISLTESGILTELNEVYQLSSVKSLQYGPALWNPAPSCNISSRSGTPVSAITIHTIQGTYAGAISWSQNCTSSVSYHYVVRSNDGQITQMVLEEDKAWHVGSENPYTIGYEHEGYVDDASWYTEAMYINSAALSRDVINSGYGIPGLRTYFGAATVGVNVLGGCTKIKGHQHYPNQTHTDPGINWNWEKYYRLINNTPTITSITATSGNFYDSGGSAGNYLDDERYLWLFEPTNAASITIDFTSFSIENNYDYLFIYDGNTIDAPLIGTYTGTTSPGTITSSGGSLMIEFRSDCGTVATGWQASYTSVLQDTQAPTTVIASPGGWITTNFTTTITDNDNQSGVAERFYLPADKSTGQIGWKANGTNGFVQEDFEDDRLSWIDQTGSFNISNAQFSFTDVAQTNSNTYAVVDQNSTTNYLYEWKQTIPSAGANQRAGLHFFCSDPTLPNRGNSYFVYFRQGTNKAQIYSVDNDVFTLQTNDTCVVDQNVQYTYRVWYSPQTGWIKVFVDGVLVTSWQDMSPLTAGNSVSFRSGGCEVLFDDLKVYRSRTNSVDIALQSDFRYQSIGSQPSGWISSLAVDALDNWSLADDEQYLVDWTEPVLSNLSDGASTDIDTTYLSTIYANWTASDPHSGVLDYEVAIGTTPSGSDIQSWTSNGGIATLTHVLATPVFDQIYYVSIRTINGAGLISESSSDGQRYVEEPTASMLEELFNHIQVYPNPATTELNITSISAPISVALFSSEGKMVFEQNAEGSLKIDLTQFATGVYSLVCRRDAAFIVKKVVIQH